MARLIFVHGAQEIEMPRGESYVGRGVDCQLRFNDAAVSRRHMRVICTNEGAYVENLSMTNGTRINGVRLEKSQLLRSGDKLEIGHRVVIVSIDDEPAAQDSGPVTFGGPLEVGPGLLVSEDLLDGERGELTRPGQGPAGLLAALEPLDERNCPKCRTRVPSDEVDCSTCGYRWPLGGPTSLTQEIKISNLPQRRDPRFIIRVPVIYSSEYLTLDATGRDLSCGGMFIASELLDPVGTGCEVTALPDGRGAVRFVAEVCHVSTEIVSGRPPGFGVRFTSMSKEGERWLEAITAQNA